MKLTLIALLVFVASHDVAAQGGKKGRSVASSDGGKKGGLSMSIPMPVDPEIKRCNAGLLSCGLGALGCRESIRNSDVDGIDPIYDTDSCTQFCAMNMNVTDYFVQFTPDLDDADSNECYCFEECLTGFESSAMDPSRFSVISTVGDKDCPTEPTDEFLCTDTEFGVCLMNTVRCQNLPNNDFEATDQQNCVDLCFSSGLPVAEFVSTNPGGELNCFCYFTKSECPFF